MQTIESKLAKVTPHAPEGWTEQDLRHLIHGVGGSPRRAKRLLKRDEDMARRFAEQYATEITSGTTHNEAAAAGGRQYTAMFAGPEQQDEDEGGGESEGGEVDATPAAPVAAAPAARRIRRQAAPQPERNVSALRDLLSL